jgi:cation transport ATPase
MALSLAGMLAAALGYLPPIAGAITQEAIDVLAVVNAIRVAIPPSTSTDVS